MISVGLLTILHLCSQVAAVIVLVLLARHYVKQTIDK